MTSYRTDGSVGPWAIEKLEILRKYLEAYTTILKNQEHWCKGFYFVDAFAGAGKAEIRKAKPKSSVSKDQLDFALFEGRLPDDDEIQYVAGSPKVALDLSNPFKAYLFIENNDERVRQLEALTAEYADSRNIKIAQGDAINELDERVINNPNINWKVDRAVVFLDPFGL